MVITIKNIPVLEGATAEDFVRNAEKNAVKVTPQVVRGGQETATKGIGEIPFIPIQLTMDGISLYDDCVMPAYIGKCGKSVSLSLAARMILMIFSFMMPIYMRMNF